MCEEDENSKSAKEEEKEGQDWKLLDEEHPVKVKKKGSDLKGSLIYKQPAWGNYSPDPSLLDLSLEIISNGVILETVKLNFKTHFILGSTDDCDFVYKNPQVSRKHLVLQYSRSNSFLIYDLNSKCGTTVNHTKILPQKYYLLSVGDQIRIGKPGMSSRTYIVTGHSVFSESENGSEDKPNTKRKEKESDIDKVKKYRKLEKELENQLKNTKVEESYYDTNLYLDEYDEYFDEKKEKKPKKQAVLSKSDILKTLLRLQKTEIDVLNSWYSVLADAQSEGKGEADSGIEAELENVRKKQINQDRSRIQRDLDKIREDLEHNFKLLRVATF